MIIILIIGIGIGIWGYTRQQPKTEPKIEITTIPVVEKKIEKTYPWAEIAIKEETGYRTLAYIWSDFDYVKESKYIMLWTKTVDKYIDKKTGIKYTDTSLKVFFVMSKEDGEIILYQIPEEATK